MGKLIFSADGLIKSAVITVAVLALLLGLDPVARAQTPNLITAAINPSQVSLLAGNTRSEANWQNDLGPVADSLPVEHLLLQLRRSAAQEQALSQLIEQLHNPASPTFHRWLTAQEFGQRFGLGQQDLKVITGWLQSNGFTINQVYPSGVLIDFSGTAGQVRTAFGTEIHHLLVNGTPHMANMSDPRIPAALAPAVVGIVSLHDFRPRQMRKVRSNFVVGSSQVVVPADLATIYNLNPLFAQGVTGVGQTVAVIEDTNVFNTGDWSTFRSTFGLSGYPGTFTTVHPSCSNPGVTLDEGEAILDAEWASASAPGATIELVSCPSSTSFGGLIALQNLVNGASPPSIISFSYGECEAANGSGNNAAYSSIYQQAVALGISIFVSAGDEGAAGCDASSTAARHGIGVNAFASTPYNVAVGGTDFGDTFAGTTSTYWNNTNGATDGSAKSYIPEIPWNDSCASVLLATKFGNGTPFGATGFCDSAAGKSYQNVVGGGGGPSGCATGSPSIGNVVSGSCAGYAKPSWQSGFAGIPSDGVRDLPDISLFAANGYWGHFYVYCDSDTGNSESCSGGPSNWSGAGGTSFSAPILAGIQALINQKAGGAQGNPNYVYYSLAAQEYGPGGNASCNSTSGNAASGSCIFYDVTQGDMDVPCTGNQNCYLPSGTVGVLSTTSSSYSPAFGTATGWDFATGIGTLNAYNLVNNWPGSAGTKFTISGQVTLGGGTLSGVTVTLSGGSSGSTTTDSSGNFHFSGLAAAGSYTVTPSLGGYSFTPPSQNFNNLSTNQVANFTASAASQILIQTVPAGLQFSVDNGLPQLAPLTVSLSTGTHTIAVAPTQGDGAGTQNIFTFWSDNHAAAAARTITVNGPATYTANFQTQYQLTISAAPPAGGTVSPASGTFYNSGALVAISATASGGYAFANWSGNVGSSGSPSTTVTMSAPQTVTANFTSQPGVTIQTSPEGLRFSIDSGPLLTAPQTLNLSSGSHTITMASTQNDGAGTQYIFNSWIDNINAPATRTISVSGAATYTATFQTQYQLTMVASPPAGGTVTPNTGIFYNSGTVVAINATASSGFAFSNWSGNVANTGIASTTVTMNAPQTVTASFSLPSCNFSLNSPGVSLTAAGTSTNGFYPSIPQSFTLTPNSGCAGVSWTAATADVSPSNAAPSTFVSLTSAAGGTGAATISFNAFTNTHLAARSATITITAVGVALVSFTINEAGSTQSMLNRETQALYQRVLGREPDPAGFSFWICTTPATVSPCGNLGVAGLGQMVDDFLQSQEGMNTDFQVPAIYQAILGRQPVFAEWSSSVAPFRVNDTPAGWSAAAAVLINTLLNSTEYASRYGPPGNTSNVVFNLYRNSLNRQPTSVELANGIATVTTSGLSALFSTIFTGAEFQNTGAFASASAATDHSNNLFVTLIYFAVLARDPDPSGYAFWVGVAKSGGAGIYFQPLGTTGANTRFQIEGPGTPNQGLVGSIEFQSLFAN